MTSRRAHSAEQTWTTRRLLHWTTGHFERQNVDSPRLAAELLLAHVLRVPRINLFMDLDRPASPLECAAYRELVERAARHEPVQYLTGEAHFFSMVFEVDPRVLIPRPSTETLVEHVMQHTRATPGFASPLIADIGTGSGCIAIALARHMPHARLIATDIDADALELAKRNAARHGVTDRIDFRIGPLYAPLAGERCQYLIANPPYISDEEWSRVEPNVKNYEPTRALRGGADGLDVLRPLIEHAAEHLASPGQLVFEIAASQKQPVLELVRTAQGLTKPIVLPDHEGLPRMLLADRVVA